ncbi:universal stress protein [Epibacterium ulvae]|uniref:universal stress protein n=1 Tax=Epibacterium ulvae TaxID=1156985 RepID=UPI002493535E|nr:universal stress protein [Epibacterium ulvae]
MSYKSLLTVITDPETALVPLTQLTILSSLFDAHADALCLGIDQTQLGIDYGATNATLWQESLLQARKDAKKLHELASTVLARNEVNFGTLDEVSLIGDLARAVARHGRFTDLIVLNKPYGPQDISENEALVEAGLFQSAAPVLVVPEDRLLQRVPRHVVIGWNESSEALTAIRKSLPFLQRAESVHVAVIDPPRRSLERSDPGGQLCQMLARHGVSCEIDVLSQSLPRTSDVLLRHAEDKNAELLVMGAYGHSRFREAILGGATRNILEQMDRPVLMAH